MNQAGEAKRIAALLNQTEALAEFGRMAQGEDDSDAERAVRQLQDRYSLWYSASLSSLPEDLRGRFIDQFEAKHPNTSPKIKQFIAHPRKPWALYNSVPRFMKSHGRWQHSLKQSYEEPLFEQRRLLLEAKGRLAINPDVHDTMDQLTELFRRLPPALTILERPNRHGPGLTVSDEYDLQKILHAVLRLHFDDVELEETTPRRAGGSYRIDFVLRQEQVAIEAKMTRSSLGTKEIRRQLIDDMFGYRGQANVAALVAVIYDPTRRIDNPAGFERDLSTDDPELPVRVVIAQG
ncbi:PD-(D/E)XK nuclease domain-containing protein [Nocardia suismassiliense]|uniref:PD-(D/E)XK nuclease domain-containing protein n=1 Tax=Nocardia suismassiliense TaxID=2077092 RepID=UPI000D1E6B70|nr:hypothetical protein [Nocardia suismassiliense]